mmetsp:Transcript_28762/g.42264  ORF Transcript_28762/g.42264 Transcript_28762/m.42264 type:complete len:109 (+) Transcript_28762:1401-1727(+)
MNASVDHSSLNAVAGQWACKNARSDASSEPEHVVTLVYCEIRWLSFKTNYRVALDEVFPCFALMGTRRRLFEQRLASHRALSPRGSSYTKSSIRLYPHRKVASIPFTS